MNRAGSIQVDFKGGLGTFDLDAAFTVPATGVSGLFGPSGCGKTTVLRCIAGLNQFTNGYCAVDNDIWQDGATFRPPFARPIGYVFQEASLFPHLSVTDNLLYATRGRKPSSAAESIGFAEVTSLLGLHPLLDRSPRHLSGGERQRVAIGRALLSQPKLLLMDEPLSALDGQTKGEILPFLERLHDALALPVIYVSHDMAEIERLADHLVLMQAGRVQASGRLSDLQSDPSLPLAGSREAAVTFDATVTAYDASYGLAVLRVDGGEFTIPLVNAIAGQHHRVTIAAGDVSLAREPPHQTTVLNILPCRLVSAEPAGDHQIVAVIRLGRDGAGARLLARVTRRSWDHLKLSEGIAVYAQIKGVALARERGSW
jgi:molybdate transport system ATP-binding protein